MLTKENLVFAPACLIDRDEPPGMAAATLARKVLALVEDLDAKQAMVLAEELDRLAEATKVARPTSVHVEHVKIEFELDETWSSMPQGNGEGMYWTSPSHIFEVTTVAGYRGGLAAHVYASLGRWEWYAFTPTGTQASKQGKEDTVEEAKAAALDELRFFSEIAPSAPAKP